MAPISNAQTIETLAKRILEADADIRTSVLAKASIIVDAIYQLGEEYEQDLAARISMSPTTFSRWKAIGSSEVIIKNSSNMPSSMRTLYELTVFQRTWDKTHRKGDGAKQVQKLIDAGKITSTTERAFVEGLIKRENDKLAKKRAKEIEKMVEELQSSKKVGLPTTLQDFIDKAELFRTFVIVPSSKQISAWKKLDFPVDIGDAYPIHEIRKTTQTAAVLCLLVIGRGQIDLGIDCLKGWGFSYRDVVTSHKSGEVILLGARGTFSREHQHLDDVSLETAISFAERIGKSPRILIGAKTDRKDWTVCNG